MTGNNHYSNCTCGWCVNNGRRRRDRSQVAADLRVHDARLLLGRNAVRTASACYVNPNARCPVCGDAVFFYANRQGSRVYFDELGHPWPKHPCTDNPSHRIAPGPVVVTPPVRRSRGLTLDLVAAGVTARLFDAPGSSNPGWRLMVVVSTESRDERHVVVAEAVDKENGKRMFGYLAPEALIAAGDFVSVKGDIISFLHPETLSHVTFMDGTAIGQAVDEHVAPHLPAPERVRPVPSTIINKTLLIKKAAQRKDERPDMTEAETIHFHGPKINVAQICDLLGPVVKSYARSGIRKPRDVVVHLNKDGYKTAAGAPWTPRLVHFLLALVFSDTSGRIGKEPTPPLLRAQPFADHDTGPLTQENIASRLSALGRVTLRGK
ncbi:hypothetical protein FJ936_06585 [Mesorhizobium sp. B2-4-13]|uniref:hypothetical protein n=1 Tax=Mesorhizobium sp. B2-4-13 TaxID=2589936 RepID=UPI00114D697B|nr:hypothetical protein [Mesorhizobium sp. B2-4-13]TPK87010.1 hypothetical protein FJ936_06585 [Mesorhizobium sp. B2-4-13]